MAVVAKRKRTQRTDDDEWYIDLNAALTRLLPANEVAPGDTWFFRTEGDALVITRSRATREEIPDDPPPEP